MNRLEMVAQLKNTPVWDIIIIGGGATGLGAAVDAASRGYKTLLVEQNDFAKGTSSRSTKLVHGGVRYLEQGNLKLVMEALRERGYLLQNAPHVTRVMPFVVPVYSWWQKFYYGTGLKFYDLLSGKLSLGQTRLLGKKETLSLLPGLTNNNVKGGILYYDGQFDDARLAIDLALTAVSKGATVLNYCSVEGLLKKNKKVTGIIAEDIITKCEYEIKARVVVNATGVFADDIMQMDEEETENLIEPSQGIHLVVDKKFFPGDHALMIPKTDDGRVLFAVPWHNEVVIGTTDTAVDDIDTEPKPLEAEIEFVLHHANRYFRTGITRADVKSSFAGLRPLVRKKGAKKTALLSRDHTIVVSKSNLVTITGGKWTTYRKMAEDVINNAAFVAKLPKAACITKVLPLQQSTKAADELNASSFNYTEKELRYYIEEEMAQTVEDVLARRTRLLFLDAATAIHAAPAVAAGMAAILHKDEVWIKEQLESFTELANNYKL